MRNLKGVVWLVSCLVMWLGASQPAMGQLPASEPPPLAKLINLQREAAQGNADAQYSLGVIYFTGDGVPKDTVKAIEWFTKAAVQGHTKANLYLGGIYGTGNGVLKDTVKAIEWYTKAAEQGDASAHYNLGLIYHAGDGVPRDIDKATDWYVKAMMQGQKQEQRFPYPGTNLGRIDRDIDVVPEDMVKTIERYTKAAEQGDASAQYNLGRSYSNGNGVPKDIEKAIEWFTKAARQGYIDAQLVLGFSYYGGNDVPKDYTKALKWFQAAAEQGDSVGQQFLGFMYQRGEAVPQNFVQAYAWFSLASAGGMHTARETQGRLEQKMTREQIAEAQRIAADFRPKVWKADDPEQNQAASPKVDATGSGFFVTPDGFFVTNHHVVADAGRISVRTANGTFPATVVRADPTNDIAILKVSGEFPALPVRGSRGLKLADSVATLGYPNPELQGLATKYSSGEIAALSGPGDDPRFLQISVPIQPGNSGGPLVDSSGCVVGVVVSQLDKIATLKLTGNIPENVNYAIKGTILLGVMEAVPGLADKVRSEPANPLKDTAEVAKAVEAACGMVVVEK